VKPANSQTDWQGVLAEAIARHGRRCYRVAWGVLRDAHAAEDVCQQAFLKAWEMQDRIREPGALGGWLLRVVCTESLQVLRRRKSDQRFQERAPRLDSAEPAFTAAERGEFLEKVREGMTDLPQATQTVLVLRLIEGLSGNEVSGILGVGPSEVSRRLHLGLEHLRLRLTGTYALDAGRGGHAM
jgi:RNA polymerase sigma-70 factor, ECF subfamily